MENNRKDPRRQLIGTVSKALGQQFERDINAAFDHYRRLGVASIEKTPEPFHIQHTRKAGQKLFTRTTKLLGAKRRISGHNQHSCAGRCP